MPCRIEIVAMKTWGELGNLLAAKTLAAVLRDGIEGSIVTVIEAETLFPRFRQIGMQIEQIVRSEDTPALIRRNYRRLFSSLTKVFYSGFEVDLDLGEPLSSEIDGLVSYFRRREPDVIIGTKGLITRLCLAAANRLESKFEIVNFITNQGLLTLEVHQSKFLSHNLVQFERARTYLINRLGFSPHSIEVVGRPIAAPEVTHFLERFGDSSCSLPEAGPETPRILVFSNRGGTAYMQLLNHIAEHHPSIPLVFIGYNEPQAVAAAGALAEQYGLRSWRIFERLGHGDYIRYLHWLSSSQYPLLISKTGPNAMLEAAYFGIPQLLLDSGLPMESWVSPFLLERSIGRGFESVKSLLGVLDSWLSHPCELAIRRKNAFEFAKREMDQTDTRVRIVNAIRKRLDRQGAGIG
jgi:UDP-N-acetylglucosamine:LPS N-acetylglucosamine transferase